MAEAALIIAFTASAAATVLDVQSTRADEKLRRQQLAREKKNAELAALDEENERLIMLQAANSDAIARSGNLDPFASPSLLALRDANLREASKDLANIQLNLATSRADISTRIAISKRRSRVAKTSGILNIIGQGASAAFSASQLGKPSSNPGINSNAKGP